MKALDRPLAAARPLGRPPKQHDQRQRILLTAAKAIATLGYEQCSLADIAAELDLTRPALYHYFATKQQIFTEIALSAVRGTFEHANQAMDSSLTATDQLKALMVAHAEYFEKDYWIINATLVGYGGITRRELMRLDEIEAYRRGYKKLMLGVIRSGIQRGEFRDVDIKATARAIFQLLNISRWYRPEGKRSASYFAKQSYELIISGLAAP